MRIFLDTRGDLGEVVGGETHQKLELIQISAGFFPATRPDRGWKHVRNTSERRRIGSEEGGGGGRDTRAASPLLSTHLWEGLAEAPSHGVQFFRHVQFFLKKTTHTAHERRACAELGGRSKSNVASCSRRTRPQVRRLKGGVRPLGSKFFFFLTSKGGGGYRLEASFSFFVHSLNFLVLIF